MPTYTVKLNGTLNGVRANPVINIELEGSQWVMLETLRILVIEQMASLGYKKENIQLEISAVILDHITLAETYFNIP